MFMTGIGSGIDFNSMIEVIVASERAPKDNQLNRQEGMNTAEMDALKEIQNTLNSFRDTVEDLNSVTELNKLKAELSNSDTLGVSIGAGAVAGEYNFEVVDLAQAQRDQLISLGKDSYLKSGKVGFTTGGKTVEVDIAALATKLAGEQTTKKAEHENRTLENIAKEFDIEMDDAGAWKAEAKAILTDPKNKDFDQKRLDTFNEGQKSYDDKITRLTTQGVSLEEVQSAINNHPDNEGVKATLVRSGDNVSLVLNANETGAANGFTVNSVPAAADVTGTLAAGHKNLQAGQDAKVMFGTMELTSSSNKMENVIDGITLTLKEPGTVNVNIARDEAGVKDTVKKFIDSYNKVMETVNTYTKSSEEQAAALSGDAGVRSMVSRLREVISDEYSASALETLSQLGITTTVSGTLEIDQSKMDKALEENFDDIANLFMGNPLDDTQPGMMDKMMTVLDDYHKNGGLFDIRQDRLEADNERIAEEREALDIRMEAKTISLRDYYAKMDSQIAQMNQTQNMMISMLM
ncbi:flagellar filament capping protein FliD [Photobacterium aphoticum]|uniref:Flagellar hook-associated protein 2 n=1 Tax=Photobacterium aphoticum TaxID=754436 RepID=A0A0J1GME2_9GAMM|nr:flagellar filament capping protein FliD [Photobacterium aphoticum]KLV00619.1 flagellar hook-associated protein FliD [Photobacterium aphoticum]PSU46318.1 flagellar hook-associated protein FliD [Photobacterium aphoticum]GHA59033.1 B-type flagellar hook-associated protein 2 [Photobacterium aphoticum]